MKLSELARSLPTKEQKGGDAEVLSLCADSRTAGEGDLFFCFRGARDGHLYAAEAVRRGAVAVVAEHELPLGCPQLLVADGRRAMSVLAAAFYGNPEKELKTIGVTGTNGKTTVTHMLYSIFTAAGKRAGLIGTLGAKFGERSVPASLTTPDPIFLFSLLADMRKAGVKYVFPEVSAHALALGKEIPLSYEVSVFTNLTQDHLDFFGSMKEYGEAKKGMFAPERCKFAVLNADDPFSSELSALGTPCTTYGLDTPADNFALIEEESLRGTRALFNLNDELVQVNLSLAGRFNVLNALAAAACARKLGVGRGAIARGLSALESVDGRLERVGSYRGADIFVDFAHTPDGLEKSLSAVRAHCTGRLILLFGCGGNRDRTKRPLMGETAAKHSDFAVITSDNPRYEDPCAIIAEIEAGFRPVSKNYVAIEEREKGIEYCLGMLKKGDVLLVAGKGGETTQEIMGIKYSYSDKATIRSLLKR